MSPYQFENNPIIRINNIIQVFFVRLKLHLFLIYFFHFKNTILKKIIFLHKPSNFKKLSGNPMQ